jgi:peptidoglycan L-alanyl-D-glutamate endopeptidase CwlK
MMDPASEARLALVNPQLASKIRLLATLLDDEGIHIRVTQGLRSWNDQQKLYAQGRTTPGKIVTNAAPGHSWHELGMACDVAPFDSSGQPDWNVSHPAWKRIVGLGESLGMYSGDEFAHCPKDDAHFQLTGTFPVSPNDEARSVFLNAGMTSVWVEAGLFDTEG